MGSSLACLEEEPVVQGVQSPRNVSLPGLCGEERVQGRCMGTCLTNRGVQGIVGRNYNNNVGYQIAGFCDDPDVHCNYDYGHSLGRGSWYFVPGEWTRLAQTVRLNTVGQYDGSIVVRVRGEEVYR